MKKLSKKKALVIGFYIITSGFLITASWLLTIIWIIICLCNEAIICSTIKYNNYPTAEGGAKRNYDRLILGSSWLFSNRNKFNTSTDYIDVAYQRNLPMIFYCCKRLYSLIKNNGEVVLYLERRIQRQPQYKYTLLDRSFILPVIQWEKGIKYTLAHRFLPLFCTPTYYISMLISVLFRNQMQQIQEFKEISIYDLGLTSIDFKAQEIIRQIQVFCKERKLNFRLMIN